MVGNLLVTVAAALFDILDRRKQPGCHLLSGLLLDVARDDAKRFVSGKLKRGNVINGTLRGHTAQSCADVSVSCIHGDHIRRGLAELWRKQGSAHRYPCFVQSFGSVNVTLSSHIKTDFYCPSSLPQVPFPAIPSAPRPYLVWNFFSAASVPLPKSPSAPAAPQEKP